MHSIPVNLICLPLTFQEQCTRYKAIIDQLKPYYNKLDKLNVRAGKRDKILLAHVQRICEAHDTVMRSYYQQIYGSCRSDATTSMENIGEQVYV